MELSIALRRALKMFLLTGALILEYAEAYNWYERNEDVCYILRYREARINRNYIDKYASARTLRTCKSACDQAFFACKSFSFSDHQSEQCLLSRDDTHSLTDRNRDFDNDQDFDYYERKSGQDCDDQDGGGSYGGSNGYGGASNRNPSYQPNREGTYGECFSLSRTRERIVQRYVRQTRRTRDRAECEDLCIRESYCRGFNYRYKSHGSYQYKDNCELSEEDTRGANSYDFNADDEFDFYEKSSNSRDCERGGGGSSGGSQGGSTGGNYNNRDDECFRVSKSNYRLDNHVVKDSLNVRDKQECEEECLRSNRFTCRSFAYRTDSYSGRTLGNSRGNSWYDRNDRNDRNDQQDNCFLSDRGTDEISSYDFIYDRDSEIYEHDPYGRNCDGNGREDNYDHNGDGGRYTVTNLECNRGSRCREDHTAGYWWCEYDVSGAWDYCCRPDEACGRSRNYEDLFAWCYVGTDTSTQWRACEAGISDRQYLKQDDPPNITTTYPSNGRDSLEVVDLDNIL